MGEERRVDWGINGCTLPTAAQGGGRLCLWRWHQDKAPGSSLGPASSSQLTDPELMIINEQLGPVFRDSHWQQQSAHRGSVDGSRR